MSTKPLALPPDLARCLSQYMDPADVCAATLVDAPHAAPKLVVYVSYIPRLRCFSAHKEGIAEIRAGSLRELCSKIAEQLRGAESTLHLRVAKAEVARRRNGGGPMAAGWY